MQKFLSQSEGMHDFQADTRMAFSYNHKIKCWSAVQNLVPPSG